jgi:mRNA interferase RelE/StbE
MNGAPDVWAEFDVWATRPKLIQRIFPKLEGLASEPRPAGSKKLKGGQREWRIRVGDYRVVYTIDDEKLVVSVMRIRHRSEVYE